jgi:hypothetical protein
VADACDQRGLQARSYQPRPATARLGFDDVVPRTFGKRMEWKIERLAEEEDLLWPCFSTDLRTKAE